MFPPTGNSTVRILDTCDGTVHRERIDQVPYHPPHITVKTDITQTTPPNGSDSGGHNEPVHKFRKFGACSSYSVITAHKLTTLLLIWYCTHHNIFVHDWYQYTNLTLIPNPVVLISANGYSDVQTISAGVSFSAVSQENNTISCGHDKLPDEVI